MLNQSNLVQACFIACSPEKIKMGQCTCINQFKNKINKNMSKVTIYCHKEHPDAVIPTVAYNNTSAAFDLTCIEDTVIPAGGSKVVPNGLNLTIDQREKYYMQIHLRSSIGFKSDMVLHSGIVDSGYTGPFGVKLYNLSKNDILINKGDRYAQVTVLEKPQYELVELDGEKWELLKSNQNRGDGGFGSSGK